MYSFFETKNTDNYFFFFFLFFFFFFSSFFVYVRLMGRSCCSPSTFNKTCGGHTHDNEQWHESINPNYSGWWWKGDTSSDEVAGKL